MRAEDYLIASEVTEKKFPGGMILSPLQADQLYSVATDCIEAGNFMDIMKKNLIYKGAVDTSNISHGNGRFPLGIPLTSLQSELLHASMGCCTESGEFLEQTINHIMRGSPLDPVNVAEELGDKLWYIALALRLLNMTFEQCMTMNIAKLKSRYGDKFSSVAAMVRNLDNERKVLDIQFIK